MSRPLKILLSLFGVGLLASGAWLLLSQTNNSNKMIVEKTPKSTNLELTNTNMKLTSQVFNNGGNIPAKYTCLGEGVNPPLTWEQVPVKTKSLVLIMDDPDAPSGVFSHWLLWDIPAHLNGLDENSTPINAVSGLGSSGENKYFGPCPPSGVHHYRFKLFALDTELFLSVNANQADLEKAMGGHILDQAILVGLFEK